MKVDRSDEVQSKQPDIPEGAIKTFVIARDEFIRILERDARRFVFYVLSIGRRS